mmetsp:Transcript_2033/g.3176  ORF Transcript_2033/g.3176 Transcript_2033/m.3176 type:complete len:320 (+) Transcript_2033:70-1029(+)
MVQLLLLVLVACASAPLLTAVRNQAFHGYAEKQAAGFVGDATMELEDVQHGTLSEGADDGRPKPDSPPLPPPPPHPPKKFRKTSTLCVNTRKECPEWVRTGECHKNVGYMAQVCALSCKKCQPEFLNEDIYQEMVLILESPEGKIRIMPQWSLAPATLVLVMELANRPAAVDKSECRFYRNEAIPSSFDGPPYGLLQGSLSGMYEMPTQEGREAPTRGAVAMIGTTMDFYISLMDHSGWAGAHTVFGRVFPEDMPIVDRIVMNSAYTNHTHPTYGTQMRMMKTEMTFQPRTEKHPELFQEHVTAIKSPENKTTNHAEDI